ncbi:MAG: hypothetical protein KGL43_03020 [Burkholderiales bacterium]|nr:hypothetical protein [Burkholderiales bacterium]MDE2398563.1 hypothetical protein [Burkholderiales bacterium]MDE2452542.1 hypothetical protein [Burkholderiales bacterium]
MSEHYNVVARSTSGRFVTLVDSNYRLHEARFANHCPEVGSELDGESPGPGFHLLVAQDGQIYRATFAGGAPVAGQEAWLR